jgi:hypothetical protein
LSPWTAASSALPQPLIEEPPAPVKTGAAADRSQDHGRPETDTLPDGPAHRADDKGAEGGEDSAHLERLITPSRTGAPVTRPQNPCSKHVVQAPVTDQTLD